MKVMVPSDGPSTSGIVELIARTPGPFYVRIARPNCPVVYSPEQVSAMGVGKSTVFREGNDATIISCGLLTYEALVAAKKLEVENKLSVGVVDLYSIKPIDRGTIVKAASASGYVVTAEEHNIYGGLGGAIAEVLGEEKPTPMRRVGTKDTFGESGEDKELMIKYGLTANDIAKNVLDVRASLKK
jgi:transketolase